MNEQLKRLAIFTIYDKDGIIDDYISYYLKDLSKNVSHIVIVCKGTVNNKGRAKLAHYTDDIFVQPNYDYDEELIREVLCNEYGWDRVLEYDELLITNDTVYGPFIPLHNVFNEMDKRNCDFWGITEYFDKDKSQPCIQSYFINIKSRLLKSDHFKLFWENYVPPNIPDTSNTTLQSYDLLFTTWFSSLGYNHSTFLKFDYSDTLNNFYGNCNYIYLDSVYMLLHKNSPFIKKSAFGMDTIKSIDYIGNEKTNEVMRFIEENTNYNVDLIWDNLLRTCNITNIKNSLYLQYILSAKYLHPSKKEVPCNKTAVIAHLFFEELLDECISYLDNIPDYIDLIITTSKENISDLLKEHFKNKKNFVVRIVPNRGRDVAALLVGCKDLLMKYDYLCFTHDKQSYHPRFSQSFRYLLWENTLASEVFIKNVVSIFESNPRMGLLVPPAPYHSWLFNLFINTWDGNFNNIMKLSTLLGLNSEISKDIPIFAFGTAFWCRTAAMRVLFNHEFSINDFPCEPLSGNYTLSHAIERILPYIAQHEGFYSGVLTSDRYAEVRMIDLENILMNTLNPELSPDLSIWYPSFSDYLNANKLSEVCLFCKIISDVYIYGTGKFAEKLSLSLNKKNVSFHGFIVSNGQEKPDHYCGKPVFWLSDVDLSRNDCGVILAMSKKNSSEVLPLLKKKNAINIYRFDCKDTY